MAFSNSCLKLFNRVGQGLFGELINSSPLLLTSFVTLQNLADLCTNLGGDGSRWLSVSVSVMVTSDGLGLDGGSLVCSVSSTLVAMGTMFIVLFGFALLGYCMSVRRCTVAMLLEGRK